jgi:hypothetical protein
VLTGYITEPVQGQYLSIKLRITNRGKEPVTFVSWTGPDMGVMFSVEKGGGYNRIPVPKQEDRSINPNDTIFDILVFETPPPLKHLELDLPLPGGKQIFRFKIPASFVERSMATISTPLAPTAPAANSATKTQDAAKTAPGAAMPTPAYDPENDQKLRTKLNREYLSAARDIKNRSLGMNTNDAARYKRTKGKELVDKLAKKYKLEVDQVRRIVGLD